MQSRSASNGRRGFILVTLHAAGKRRRAAFTLIELLIVIGIIAALSAILVPVLGRARESGRRLACLSNLRQISVAVLMYEQQWKRLPGPTLPAILGYDVVNIDPPAAPILTGYYRARVLSNRDILMKNLNQSRSVLSCPSAAQMTASATPWKTSSPYYGQVLGYAYKVNNQRHTSPSYFFGSHTSSNTIEEKQPKRLVQVKAAGDAPDESHVTNKTDIWMISDLDGQNFRASVNATADSDDFGISDIAVPDSQKIWQPVHRSGKVGRNYVFFDGHAEWRSIDNWPVRW